ncbi:MAG TPA: MaoC/PaaZ C-terminal domain-containing protein [Acidimicrobiia bacterium]|nr:MaoC/PaaZ C-terminal domain-containing protein [Acidimicrobiia bacterium]
MSIEVGTEIPPFAVGEVSTEKMKTMALLLRDPNPIHWNVESVVAAGLGDRVINQGPTNKAFIVNAIIGWLGDPARLRSITVRFRGNVYGGESVEAGGVVTAIRDEDGERLADCDVWLRTGDGRDVIVGTATVVA